MAQLIITTTPTNSGLGTPINQAFNDVNNNFGELYSRVQTSPPATLIGTNGDTAGMYAYDSSYFYYCFADYNGTSEVWGQVSSSANIASDEIRNGNSAVTIPISNGNIFFNIGNVSNVLTITASGATTTGNVSVSDTVLSQSISATGNITGGNVTTVGNIAGTFFLGNGSQLTGIVTNYSNTNVASYLTSYVGNISANSIFVDNYYYGNGIPFSGGGGSGSYNDSNVAAYLPTYTGNLGGKLTSGLQNNITQVGTLTQLTVSAVSGIDMNAVASNVEIYTTFGGSISINPSDPGNINNMAIGLSTPAVGQFTDVSAIGNVTATYFIGDGGLLSNISGSGSGSYNDSNVAAYLPTYTGNLLAGNISVIRDQTVGGSSNVLGNVNVTNTVNTSKIIGQLTGTINGLNTLYGDWDFGSISGTTFDTPIAWIFAQTSAGNIDMGTVGSPSSNNIDIGTIY
jgi:hypothetical protein